MIISRSCDLDPDLECLDQPTLVVTTTSAPVTNVERLREHVEVVQLIGDELSFHHVIDLLRDQGLTQILVEGGAALLSAMMEQQAIDELCLTISPQLIGSQGLPLINGLAAHATLELAHLVAAPDAVFTRYLVVGD